MRALLDPFPGAYAVFEAVRAVVARFGPVEVTATKSQVSFRNRIRFAWLWLPILGLRRGPADVYVSFALPAPIASPRIKEVVEVAPGRFQHHVLVPDASRMDAELVRWLRAAYQAAG